MDIEILQLKTIYDHQIQQIIVDKQNYNKNRQRFFTMQASQYCALCNKANDQMLMLSCVHDPCIQCAASAFADQVHIKGHSSQIYVCEICGQETSLDASTINELNTLAKSVIKSPSKGPKSPNQNKSRVVGHAHVATNSHLNSKKKDNVGPVNAPTTYYCKDHSEQQISYYCFTCHANICPQCAIHGAHKDHQVKLTKKAIVEVKNEYMQIISKVGASQNIMSKYKDGYLRLIKQTNQKHGRQKILVSRQFQLMRNALVAKQRQILKDLDEINKQNVQTLTTALEGINENHEDVIKVKKSVQATLKKDEVLILEEYKNINQSEEKVALLTKSSETVTGNLHNLNSEFLQQQAKQLTDTIINIKVNMKKQQLIQSINFKHMQG